MEKVMLLSVECYRDAVFVTGMCSSLYLVSQYWEFFLSVAHALRNMAGEFGSFSHTCASEEQHSFCVIERNYFCFCKALSNAMEQGQEEIEKVLRWIFPKL